MAPDILVIGQITVDDMVPAQPGPWRRQVGGNALYAAAGARLWCDPARIGVVARLGSSIPFDIPALLHDAGLTSAGLRPVAIDHLVEWIVYEEDGSRQSLPRNPDLRDPAADIEELFARYLRRLESISASFEDIPKDWLSARAIHLAPQVLARHEAACRALRTKAEFLSVDPSPHYSRGRDVKALAATLTGISAFLPSQAEVQHLSSNTSDWPSVVRNLCAAGFPEVVLKLGGAGALIGEAADQQIRKLPAAAAAQTDPTGAGDAFSGAYSANRALGLPPLEAAQRAAVAAAMVIQCSGADEALRLKPDCAQSRLRDYLALLK